jgi:hypothetical protein
MKRSTTWLVASVLSILVVFCAGLVGATLAKYVVGKSGVERARVAKWGVVVTVRDESAFKTEYESENKAGTLSVKSSSTDRLVAPGTADEEGIVFSIKGKPEVATKVDVQMQVNSDVFLDDYYPVVFTLTETKSATGFTKGPVIGTLSEIESALENWAETAYFDPNTDLETEFNLTWKWVYENGTDAKDNLLGRLAAGETNETYTQANEGVTWSVNIDYDIQFTVTQVS